MSMMRVLERAKALTNSEKAMVAHCLISSLDAVQEDDVEEAWIKLADKRYKELESGTVRGVSWDQLRKEVRG